MSVLYLGVFFGILTDNCSAEDDHAEISIIGKTYDLLETVGSGAQTAYRYKITITLYNSGDIISEDTTVRITDEYGIPTMYNDTILPQTSIPFVFDDWWVVGLGEQTVNIRYYPTNESINPTSYNSGVDTIVLNPDGEGDGESTPGFEIILLIIAIAAIVFCKRK